MDLIPALSAAIDKLGSARARVLVGIDGPDGSGKTTLADNLAESLTGPVLRASIDGFHNPTELRRRRGDLSPEGYYRDSFDHQSLLDDLLDPFATGQGEVLVRRYDWRTGAGPLSTEVPEQATLLFDGVFLLRPELRNVWHLTVYLRVGPEESLRRALERDLHLFGSDEEVRKRYLARYLPGQALYQNESDPEGRAHVVVDNNDPMTPVILRWTGPDVAQ